MTPFCWLSLMSILADAVVHCAGYVELATVRHGQVRGLYVLSGDMERHRTRQHQDAGSSTVCDIQVAAVKGEVVETRENRPEQPVGCDSLAAVAGRLSPE
jgi:hypothetical protein